MHQIFVQFCIKSTLKSNQTTVVASRKRVNDKRLNGGRLKALGCALEHENVDAGALPLLLRVSIYHIDETELKQKFLVADIQKIAFLNLQ